jgi:hypothetical protein
VRIRSRREKGKQKHTATKVWTEEMLGAGNRLGGRVLSKGRQSSSARCWLADVPYRARIGGPSQMQALPGAKKKWAKSVQERN